MTKEAPPFYRPEPLLKQHLTRKGAPRGRQSCELTSAELGCGFPSGDKACDTFGRVACFSGTQNLASENGVPPPVLKHGPRSQTDAQGRRYCCQYFSRTERESRKAHWCAHTTNAQHQPAPCGLSLSVPVWTRKVVNYA